MKRFVINLYFDSEREWCWFRADNYDEAYQFALDWAENCFPGPSVIAVYEAPES